MTELFNVLGLDPSDGIVRAVAFGLPAAVLLTLLVLWRVKARSKSARRKAARQAANVEARAGAEHVSAPALDKDAAALSASLPSSPQIVSAPQLRSSQSPTADAKLAAVEHERAGHAAPAAPAAKLVPPVAPASTPSVGEREPAQKEEPAQVETVSAAPAEAAPLDLAVIKVRLDEAVKAAPKTALAPLYLEYASQCRKAGDEAACLAALRSAAGYGALHGPRVAHAAARVELAEVAYASGDAIGACEQWQIARLVLHEEGLKDAYARIDKRMRENGCPTDWVLTDF